MNNRIQELGRQAQIWCDQNIPGEFNEITGGYGHHWEEKFAELIVRECCQMMINLERKYPANLTVKEIKQHFGVE